MRIDEIRNLTDEELQERILELNDLVFDSKIKAIRNELKDIAIFKKSRREIARILTLINERKGLKNATQS